MSNLETAYFLDSNAEIESFKISQNYIVLRNKKQLQIFEIFKTQTAPSKYKKVLKREIKKKILHVEINDIGNLVNR